MTNSSLQEIVEQIPREIEKSIRDKPDSQKTGIDREVLYVDLENILYYRGCSFRFTIEGQRVNVYVRLPSSRKKLSDGDRDLFRNDLNSPGNFSRNPEEWDIHRRRISSGELVNVGDNSLVVSYVPKNYSNTERFREAFIFALKPVLALAQKSS